MLLVAGVMMGCGLFGPRGFHSYGYCTRAITCHASECVKHIAHDNIPTNGPESVNRGSRPDF